MSLPLVSIVVPLYNKEKYILECLMSISQQDYPNWECLIVDDGSEDHSLAIVEKFVLLVPGNWKIFRKTNGGPSSARNLGIKKASGEFIAFLDADDIWLPRKLSHQISYMKSTPSCTVSLTDYVIASTPTSDLRAIRSSRSAKLVQNWLNMRGFGGLVESTGMIHRKAGLESLLFDETLQTGEGLDFMLRVSQLGPLVVVPDLLTIYRLSDGQLHRNEALIKSNSRILAEKYATSSQELVRTMRNQDSYFELSALRKVPRIMLLRSLSQKLLRFELPFILMVMAILTRNVKGRLIAPSAKRQVNRSRDAIRLSIVNLSQ